MTPQTRVNIYIQPPSPTVPADVGTGLQVLLEECSRLNVKKGWIICPVKHQLTKGSDIAKALSDEEVIALKKHQSVFRQGIELLAFTGRQLDQLGVGDGVPVLAVHVSAKLLDKLDEFYDLPSLIVVPWNDEADTKKWREKRSPAIRRKPK